ncbi:hypothetical protein RFM41_04000 [Mesorhizobium sp. VK25A]|uniref:Uncharacterized protein n=1 Tax=Mesorhizobium vachelliae TaxID=3072309 RepID=A0ABU5A126_9HYPH|nr:MULTISPECIES: hypothetical protein [unclassified Mesorhizobium]MDX8531365.1 hypothetical protein [Mesorhizobium sp. VK25D]MDX8542884.1 hypothetical protein [Mesorhizobium sp. VK25A]
MKKSHAIVHSGQNSQFVLTSDRGEKISAVEGLKLSRRMAKILKESRARGLTGDERRALIKEQASRKK